MPVRAAPLAVPGWAEGTRATPPAGQVPVADAKEAGGQWKRTVYIELIVDGEIVDLSRIPLPPT